MTLANLILGSLYAGLFLIALGVVLDLLQARHRRREARLRTSGPFAALEPWNVNSGPHLGHLAAPGHEPSPWPR